MSIESKSIEPRTDRDTLGSTSHPLPPVLLQFMWQSLFWTVLCFGIEATCHFILHLRFPYDYPAVPFVVGFGDFRFFLVKLSAFHTRSFFTYDRPLMYPAPVVVAYKILMLFPLSKHSLFVTIRFLVILFGTSWMMLLGLYRGLLRRGVAAQAAKWFVAAVYLLSFPFWFEVHQANIEFVVWVMVTLGIWACWTNRPWTAAIFIGIAASMKIFPLVFLGLFLTRKQYRQAGLTVLVVALSTVLSLWLVCPDIAYSWRQTNAAIAQFRVTYMLHLLPIETGFDHSLFCLFKKLAPVLPPPATLDHLLSAYLAIGVVGGILLYFLRIRKLPFVNQVLCLSIAAILLPPTSYDYTLLHLYPPFVLLVFVATDRRMVGRSLSGLAAAFVLFAFLLAPQSEFIHHGLRFAGQLKAIALCLLWLVALIYPFPGGEADHGAFTPPAAA